MCGHLQAQILAEARGNLRAAMCWEVSKAFNACWHEVCWAQPRSSHTRLNELLFNNQGWRSQSREISYWYEHCFVPLYVFPLCLYPMKIWTLQIHMQENLLLIISSKRSTLLNTPVLCCRNFMDEYIYSLYYLNILFFMISLFFIFQTVIFFNRSRKYISLFLAQKTILLSFYWQSIFWLLGDVA